MSSKVNEKSTKPEIWAAYKELLLELQAGPIAVTDNNKVSELSTILEQSRSDLITKFETTLKAVDSAANDYVVAEQTLTKRKAEIINGLEQSRNELQTTIDQVRRTGDKNSLIASVHANVKLKNILIISIRNGAPKKKTSRQNGRLSLLISTLEK